MVIYGLSPPFFLIMTLMWNWFQLSKRCKCQTSHIKALHLCSQKSTFIGKLSGTKEIYESEISFLKDFFFLVSFLYFHSIWGGKSFWIIQFEKLCISIDVQIQLYIVFHCLYPELISSQQEVHRRDLFYRFGWRSRPTYYPEVLWVKEVTKNCTVFYF